MGLRTKLVVGVLALASFVTVKTSETEQPSYGPFYSPNSPNMFDAWLRIDPLIPKVLQSDVRPAGLRDEPAWEYCIRKVLQGACNLYAPSLYQPFVGHLVKCSRSKDGKQRNTWGFWSSVGDECNCDLALARHQCANLMCWQPGQMKPPAPEGIKHDVDESCWAYWNKWSPMPAGMGYLGYGIRVNENKKTEPVKETETEEEKEEKTEL